MPTTEKDRHMPTMTTIRARTRAARGARATRRTLERELASYTTEEDLNDLHAILDRYSYQETADIRRILAARSCA
jgi:hypothetical protein